MDIEAYKEHVIALGGLLEREMPEVSWTFEDAWRHVERMGQGHNAMLVKWVATRDGKPVMGTMFYTEALIEVTSLEWVADALADKLKADLEGLDAAKIEEHDD